MGVSVSFHVSTGLKNKSSLKNADKHNERKYKKKSSDTLNSAINFEHTKFNKILVGTKELYKDVQKVYKEEFGKAVDEYNEKQKKPSRRIYDYFEKVSENARTNLYTEIVVQIGDIDFWENKNIDDRKKMVDVFEKQLDLINEFYPNFKVANATIHLDETSPHMHIVGVCSSNEDLLMKNFPNEKKKKRRGLEKYVSQREVFTQANLKDFHNFFDKKSVELLNDRYNLNEVLNDKKIKQKYFELEIYKEHAKEIRELQKEYDSLKKDISNLKSQKETFEKENKNLDFALENLKKEKKEVENLRNKIKTKKSDLELLVCVYEDLYKQKIMLSDNYKLTKEQLDFLVEKSKKVDKLEDENSDLRFKNSRLEFENSRLEIENDNLKKEKLQEKDFSISKYDLEKIIGKEQLKELEERLKEKSNSKENEWER